MSLIGYLRSPQAIRDRAEQLFALALADELDYFRVDLAQMPTTADYVLGEMRCNYPDLAVPFHSRWRHFEVAGVSRLRRWQAELEHLEPLDYTRTLLDLAVVSVLLDAGAGETWCYTEPGTGERFSRSEGLAIASLHSFFDGLFSSDPARPWQADALGLQRLSPNDLAHAFQVSSTNPLLGLEGRVGLLQRLGQVLLAPDWDASTCSGVARPSDLLDFLLAQSSTGQPGPLEATTVLDWVLTRFSSIWPGRLSLDGINLGDVWPHPKLSTAPLGANWVPFHKLSQWLSYSLLEPLQEAGFRVTGLDQLTGLAEYRNGGLFLDLGVLQLKDPTLATLAHRPDAPLIVEWRSLTLALLDRLALRLREQLDLTAEQLPLVKILQGGTWSAGRRIAQSRRPGGPPPLTLCSDGTVF